MRSTHRVHFRLAIWLLLAAMLLLPLTVWAATVDAYGGTYANWPDGHWRVVPGLTVDPNGDVTNPDPNIEVDQVDIVGNNTYPAVYYYGDSDYVYFRVRVNVDAVDIGSIYGTFNDTIMILIDGGSEEGEPDHLFDYAFAWDTNGIPHQDHGLEMLVRPDEPMPATWAEVTLDDLDGDETAKLAADIDLTGGEGYVRLVDGQTGAGSWSPSTFIDFAVSWDYLINEPNITLAPGQAWLIQVATLSDQADHSQFNGDLAGSVVDLNENPILSMLGTVAFKPTAVGINTASVQPFGSLSPWLLVGAVALLLAATGLVLLRYRGNKEQAG